MAEMVAAGIPLRRLLLVLRLFRAQPEDDTTFYLALAIS